MTYKVVIERSAAEELHSIMIWLSQDSDEVGRNWYQTVKQAILTLKHFPFRCALAPENESFDEEIRHLLYGKRRYVYRVLFTICGDEVRVLHVRHGAQLPLKPSDFE